MFDPSDSNELKVTETSIPGLLSIDLVVHGDNRGWFKENFQQEKLVRLGFPKDFVAVQNNVSYNEKRGVTRGIHAEPWEKFISTANGSVYSVIVDLRPGDTFGRVEKFEITPGKAIFVPRGCGNSFQTLEDHTTYIYLVNEHWYPEAKYTSINLADPELNIDWPVPLDQAEVSEKDLKNPMLSEIKGEL
jgi:dTDP-4-dehydrorhamnose 3,5-epimerase/reductase